MLALTLAMNLAIANQARVTSPVAPPTINVAVHDYANVPPEWLRRAQNEMTRIFRDISVEIVWWDPRPSSAGGDPPLRAHGSDTVTVPQYLFTVSILHSPGSPPQDLPENAAGFASGTAAERGRVAYVFYDQSEQFTPLFRAKFLGHVMAHEMGHLLLPQYSHSPKGLMRAQWSREDLELAQYGRLGFTPEQASLIRSKVSQFVGRGSNPQ